MAVSRIGRSDVQSNPRTSYCLTRTTEEADNLTDPVDGETGCFSKLPTAVAGAEDPRNFHGKISASGNGGGTNWAAGGVDVFASFDPGVYRNYLTAEPTPFDDSHSFTTLWLPWR